MVGGEGKTIVSIKGINILLVDGQIRQMNIFLVDGGSIKIRIG